MFPEGDEVVRGARSPELGEQILLNNLGPRLDRLPAAAQLARIVEDVTRRGDRTGGSAL